MPFTGSHVAAVLPLMRWGLVPSALVIGSMTPDLPYYLPTPFHPGTTHSMIGVVGVDVLLGGVAFGVWQYVLAPFAIAIAPANLRDRLDPRPSIGLGAQLPGWRPGLMLVVSLAVGAATHVLWDSFTHAGRWGPAHIGWLADSHAGLAGYRWTQIVSSIIGAAAIAVWLARWWTSARWSRTSTAQPSPRAHRPPVERRTAYAVWIVIGLATIIGGLAGALSALGDAGRYDGVFLAATRGGGAGLAAAIGCAICWLVLPRWRASARPLPRRR